MRFTLGCCLVLYFDAVSLQLLERLRFKFKRPNGKRKFVPRGQVFPSIVVYCLLPPLKNK